MKYLILLIFSFPLNLSAQAELSSMLKDIQSLGGETSPKCSPADYQTCAKDLCGPVKAHEDMMNSSDSGVESYDAKKYGDIEAVKRRIQKILEKKREANTAAINKKREELPKIAEENMEQYPGSLDRDARQLFEPFISITYSSGILKVKPAIPAGSSSEFSDAIKAFAEKIRPYYLRYPDVLFDKKIINQDEMKILEKKRIDVEYAPDELCLHPACKKVVVNKQIEVFTKNLSGLEDKNLKPETLEDALLKCTSNYIYYANSADKAEKFKELLPQVKLDFVNKGMTGFSDHSKKIFADYLEKDLVFDFGLVSPLKSLEKSEKNITVTENLESAIYLETPDDPFDNIPVCESQSDSYLKDAFVKKDFKVNEFDPQGFLSNNNKSDTVAISRKTCRFHTAGLGVIAHEIAHSLSHVFSQKKLSPESYQSFMATRNCVTKMYPNYRPSDFQRHDGDSNFTEEDTADFFAFRTHADKDTVGMCFLLIPKGEVYFHVSGNRLEEARPSLTNAGSHSPSFVRILREALYKNKALPESCENVVKEYRDTYKDHNLCQ